MKRPGGETGRRNHTVPQLSPSVQNGDELRMALRHPENEAVPLLRWLARELGKTLPHNLNKKAGVVCDLRPGHEEQQPSLSYGNKAAGAVFRRFGSDDRGFGAVKYVAECLGITESEAAKRLIERAGISSTSSTIKIPKKPTASVIPQVKVQPETEKTAPLARKELENTLRLWKPAATDHPEIARRGLGPAVENGLLHAYAKGDDLAFKIRGPDGEVYAVKQRSGKGKPRYSYLTKGRGAPAWCSPNITAATAEIWIEGELNAVAVAQALSGTEYGVQGIAGTGGRPHLQHLEGSKKAIYIYADPDDAGQKARTTWEELARSVGLAAVQLPDNLFAVESQHLSDACDVLAKGGDAELKTRLVAALGHDASENDVYKDNGYGYGIREGRLISLRTRTNKKGEIKVSEEVLTEFIAFITEERRFSDGVNEPVLEFFIEGYLRNGRPFPEKRSISSDEFSAMNWPLVLGGTGAVIHAGRGKKDHVRACIQLLSQARGIKHYQVVTHTGWHDHNGQPVYLTNGAIISAGGAVEGVQVKLHDRLEKVSLPEPAKGAALQEALLQTLGLWELVPPEVGVPTLGALYRSALGKSDNMVVLVGRTGTNKTTWLALLMAHYGAEFNRLQPPSSWHSSANALEQLAFCAKDMLLLIDDYKPQAGQSREVSQALSRIIHGIADGAGRATLTAERKARPNIYPRGTVITSAEEFPAGESNQARTLIVSVSEPLLGKNHEHSVKFFEAEELARDGVYAQAMAGYIQFIAQRYDRVRVGSEAHRQHVREVAQVLPGHHGRTGMAAAELSYGWRVWLSYAVQSGVIEQEDAAAQWEKVLTSLQEVVGGQREFQQTQNPVGRFLQVLNTLLLQGKVYLEDASVGGCPPDEMAASAGWQSRKRLASDQSGEVIEEFFTAPSAEKVGWVGEAGGRYWAFLMPDAVYRVVQQMASQQNQNALPSQEVMWLALRDALHDKNLMRCAIENRGDRKTLVRPRRKTRVHGSAGQLVLLNLAFPLEGLLEQVGGDAIPTGSQQPPKNFPPFQLLA